MNLRQHLRFNGIGDVGGTAIMLAAMVYSFTPKFVLIGALLGFGFHCLAEYVVAEIRGSLPKVSEG